MITNIKNIIINNAVIRIIEINKCLYNSVATINKGNSFVVIKHPYTYVTYKEALKGILKNIKEVEYAEGD